MKIGGIYVCAVAFACAAGSAFAAVPTVEQMQERIRVVSMPRWQQAVAQVRSYRANLSDPELATWKALDAETDTGSGKAPLTRATTPTDAKDAAALTAWLRWRVLSENADPRFSYAYAHNLYYLNQGAYRREALVFLVHARLALAIDGARCGNQASPQGVGLGYESQPAFQPIVKMLAAAPPRDRAIAMLEAVALEEVRGQRPLLTSLCTRDAGAVLKALEAGRPLEPLSSADPRAAAFGKSYAVDTSGVAADLVPDDEWRTKRREILNTHIGRALDLL